MGKYFVSNFYILNFLVTFICQHQCAFDKAWRRHCEEVEIGDFRPVYLCYVPEVLVRIFGEDGIIGYDGILVYLAPSHTDVVESGEVLGKSLQCHLLAVVACECIEAS